MIHDGLVDRFFKLLGPQPAGFVRLRLHRDCSGFEVLIRDFEIISEVEFAKGETKGDLGRECSLGEETDDRECDRKEAWLEHNPSLSRHILHYRYTGIRKTKGN